MIPQFWLVILVAIVGFIVQARLQSVFAKYSKVPFPGGLTGRDVAEKMLRDNGITNVRITSTRGNLTDNFNPSNLTVNLSEPVYGTNSISAGAVAAHECGHAVQHARGYAPMKLRAALVPVVTFSSRIAMWVVLAGLLVINTLPSLFWIGIGLLAVALLFSLVTLPVELNASRRALAWLKGSGLVDARQLGEAKQALTWAAITYIVAALSALTSIISYIGIARNRR
ncbi:MAG: zinc metallopeptidase [Rikenellaceae bacterium]|nr:zinc metallopeptidase [Rikenellaceae bacterium]